MEETDEFRCGECKRLLVFKEPRPVSDNVRCSKCGGRAYPIPEREREEIVWMG